MTQPGAPWPAAEFPGASSPAETAYSGGQATGHGAASVDALRLLRMVRARRELKLLCILAVIAVPVWAAFTLAAESIIPRTSPTFWRLDSKIGPVFLIILSVLMAAFVLLLGTRLLGHTGRVAARLSPVLRRPPDLDVAGVPPPLRPLFGHLRRKSMVSLGAVVLFVGVGVLTGLVAWNVWPAWRANHGHGGPTVTIGRDATISGSSVSSHGIRTYFLTTPYGPAVAEDHHPRDGQRWTVLPSDGGNDKAYLIGGHDYLLIGAIAAALLAFEAGIVGSQVRRARVELAMRAATPGSLADSLDHLRGGRSVPLDLPGTPAVTLTLGRRGGPTALARHRLIGVGVVVLVAAGGATLGLWQSGAAFRSGRAVTERSSRLGFLAGTGWDPEVFVSYTHMDASAALITDGLRDAGITAPAVTMTATVVITPAGSGASAPPANVDVARIGSASATSAVSGVIRLERNLARYAHGRASAMSGLPDGWHGLAETRQASRPQGVEMVDSSAGRLVWISLHGNLPLARIEQRGTQLARAISTVGVGQFSDDIAR